MKGLQVTSLDSGQVSWETEGPSRSSRRRRRSKSSSILASTRWSSSSREQDGRRTRDSPMVSLFCARPYGSTSALKVRSLLRSRLLVADASLSAMAALGLPTSRALALVGIPGVKVRRERIETAAIVTRVASSWIRIGVRLFRLFARVVLTRTQNFEIQATRKEWEALRKLSSYVGTEVFKFDDATCPPLDSKKGRGMALSVLREVSNRNAIMIAGWQAYGCVPVFLSLSQQADVEFDADSCTES